MKTIIKLYGTERCHKTKYYQSFFKDRNLDYIFYDVEQNEEYAEELKSLYESRNLHLTTITVGEKRLRNPSDKDLNKWI